MLAQHIQLAHCCFVSAHCCVNSLLLKCELFLVVQASKWLLIASRREDAVEVLPSLLQFVLLRGCAGRVMRTAGYSCLFQWFNLTLCGGQ